MERQHRVLPVLALLTGLAWMAAVLLVAANPKDLSLAGDLAYDGANRVHTVSLAFLLATAILVFRMIRAGGLPGGRAAKVFVAGAALLLVGNVVGFWGALAVGQQSEQFWGGLVGWIMFVLGELLVIGAPIGLARAARRWPHVSGAQRWFMGAAGLLLSITTGTWAISPIATLIPAVLAAFALLALGTVVARASTAEPLPGHRAPATA